MICRTCKGTGKVKYEQPDYRKGREGESVEMNRTCPDCYGSGKVINKEESK